MSRNSDINPPLANDEKVVTHGSQLPPNWRTLYELTQLSDAEFDAAAVSEPPETIFVVRSLFSAPEVKGRMRLKRLSIRFVAF